MSEVTYGWAMDKEYDQILNKAPSISYLSHMKIFVARVNGKVIGYVVFSASYLARLFVEPKFRKTVMKGELISEKLMQRAVTEYLGANKFQKIYLIASADNKHGQRNLEEMLRRIGFDNPRFEKRFEMPKSAPLPKKPVPKTRRP